MTTTLLLVLKLSVGAIILAIGMDSRLSDLVYLWKRPGLLLRSLLAMYVLVPLVALILVKGLTLPPGVEIGLLVLAVSAGALLLPRKLMHLGQGEYVFSLVVTSTLLAIFIVPAWLAVLGPRFGNPEHLEPMGVAAVFAKSFFGPLAVGMLAHWLFPEVAERFGDRLMRIAGIALVASGLVLLALHWEVVLQARWLGALTLAALCHWPLAWGSGRRRPHGSGYRLFNPASRHCGAGSRFRPRTTNGSDHRRLYLDGRDRLDPVLEVASPCWGREKASLS